MNKKQMRKDILAIRDSISKEDILKKSEIILNKVKATDIFKNSKNIMLFTSFGSEVYTHDFIVWCKRENKNIVLPYIDKSTDTMKISVFNSFDDMKAGYKGILEVKEECIHSFDEKKVELIITPCVCYDFNKYRIGYGKGFYDRFFAKTPNAFKIGICFDECLVDSIEYDEYDVKTDMVITDKRVII